jgi:hypothetical protein
MVLAAIPLAGFNLLGIANADDSAPATGTKTTSVVINGEALTSDQIQCMTDHGFAPPKPIAGQVTGEGAGQIQTNTDTTGQLAAFKDAARACGLPVPDKASASGTSAVIRQVLSPEQLQCLTDHGAPPPGLAKGAMPAPPSPQQLDTLRAAAQACGLPAPVMVTGGPGSANSTGLTTSKQS